MSPTPKVLFVCTYRGGRSQVADSYAEKHGKGVIESSSACFDPGIIGPGFINVAAKHGIEINRESPASPFDASIRKIPFDYVICLCSNKGSELCSVFITNIDKLFPKAKRLHWEVLDFGICQDAPEGFEACVTRTCQQLEAMVQEFVESVNSN